MIIKHNVMMTIPFFFNVLHHPFLSYLCLFAILTHLKKLIKYQFGILFYFCLQLLGLGAYTLKSTAPDGGHFFFFFFKNRDVEWRDKNTCKSASPHVNCPFCRQRAGLKPGFLRRSLQLCALNWLCHCPAPQFGISLQVDEIGICFREEKKKNPDFQVFLCFK